MSNGTLTEPRTVPRRKPTPPPTTTPPDEPVPPFGRIELQAPPEWIEELDRVADAVGMSRSAYIRNACNRQMAADRRDGLAK